MPRWAMRARCNRCRNCPNPLGIVPAVVKLQFIAPLRRSRLASPFGGRCPQNFHILWAERAVLPLLPSQSRLTACQLSQRESQGCGTMNSNLPCWYYTKSVRRKPSLICKKSVNNRKRAPRMGCPSELFYFSAFFAVFFAAGFSSFFSGSGRITFSSSTKQVRAGMYSSMK